MEEIVTLGSGTGQRRLLEGLAGHPFRITAIVGVTDNGGSSAVIRKSMNIPQPGDAKNCLVGLSEEGLLKELFEYRFDEGDLAGMSLGNYVLAALTRLQGDFGLAVEKAGELLRTRGRVLPAFTRSTNICAELVTGWKITGEWEIIRREPRARIKRLFLEEPASLYPPCAEAISRADVIVIGPGSLLTGTIPVLLTSGMTSAIRNSSAKVVYVCNLMTQPGQTDGLSAREHVEELESYLGINVDHVVVNTAPIPDSIRTHYARIGAEPVADDLGSDVRVVRKDLLHDTSLQNVLSHNRPDNVFLLHHDPKKLADAVVMLSE